MFVFFLILPFITATLPNILHIIADDLSIEYTGPNMRRLSKLGVSYINAYSNFPVCSPSRSSFMTGQYPDRLKVYSFIEKVEKEVTIPSFLKNALGYKTASFGKIFHWPKDGPVDIYQSHWTYKTKTYGSAQAYFPDANSRCKMQLVGCFIDEEDAVDHQVVNQAMEYIRASVEPWYVAIGFYRPHLNNAVPKETFKRSLRFDLENLNTTLQTELTSLNYFECDDLKAKNIYSPTTGTYTKIVTESNPNRASSCLFTKNFPKDVDKIVNFYKGAVFHIDEELGRILDYFENNPSKLDNTMIIFHSDHGWSNGKNCIWCKNTLYDISSKVPLTIKYPKNMNIPSSTFTSYVQLIDIFPTILEVVGGEHPCAGKSLVNVEESSSHFSITQYPRCKQNGEIQDNNCMFATPPICTNFIPPLYMGYAFRNGDGSIFVWKPFRYKQKSCSKPYTKSVQALPIIDKQNSFTDWSKDDLDITTFTPDGIPTKDKKLTLKLYSLLLEKISN